MVCNFIHNLILYSQFPFVLAWILLIWLPCVKVIFHIQPRNKFIYNLYFRYWSLFMIPVHVFHWNIGRQNSPRKSNWTSIQTLMLYPNDLLYIDSYLYKCISHNSQKGILRKAYLILILIFFDFSLHFYQFYILTISAIKPFSFCSFLFIPNLSDPQKGTNRLHIVKMSTDTAVCKGSVVYTIHGVAFQLLSSWSNNNDDNNAIYHNKPIRLALVMSNSIGKC